MPEVNIDGRIRFVTQGITLEGMSCTATAALVFYDYFLTLDLEVQNIWRKQFRLPTLIFLLNRYLGIAFSIALMYPAATQEDYVLQIVFGTLLSLTEAVFFALRAYALWGCKRVIFIAVILAYIPGFSANLCTMLLRDAPATLALKISTLIPVFFILFDTLVLSLSLAALWRSHGSSLSKLGGLPALFFQHGIIYFVLLLILNIPRMILTHVVQQPLNAGVMHAYCSVFVTRFMLQLRESSSLPHHTRPDLSKWSIISREMIVGNLAEPFVEEEVVT